MGWVTYVRTLVGYILPLEVVTAVGVVFSFEHVVEWVVELYLPHVPEPVPWLLLGLGIAVVSAVLGSNDEEFEEELDN